MEKFFPALISAKAANIVETSLYTKAFLGIFLDFNNFQHSKNIYQGLTLKYHKNSFSIYCT